MEVEGKGIVTTNMKIVIAGIVCADMVETTAMFIADATAIATSVIAAISVIQAGVGRHGFHWNTIQNCINRDETIIAFTLVAGSV